jgi:subtilisin family serine protease/glucose/arabinose dehydrogenase
LATGLGLFSALFILIYQPGSANSVVRNQDGIGGAPRAGIAMTSKGLPHLPGEVLVKFKKGMKQLEKKQYHDEADAEVLSEINELEIVHVKSKKGESTEALIERYKKNPFVEFAEPNGIFHTMRVPNDPRLPELWGMNNTGQTGGAFGVDIKAEAAWDLQIGNRNVIVADLDTGVDVNHPDLAANVWTNPGEVFSNGIDDDRNGFVDDVHGWNFVSNNNNILDNNGHGTHTTGTMAAVGNNGIGVVGVAWQAQIMPVKVLDNTGSGSFSAIANGILYASRMGAKVANMSFGCEGPSSCFSQTIENAINVAAQRGMLIVAAAGNTGANNNSTTSYPCTSTSPNVICVAATDQNDRKPAFSNFGSSTVDLGAPGVNILSTVPTGSCEVCAPSGYRLLSGTSMATPHVTGAAALLFARFQNLTTDQVKSLLLNNVDRIPSLSGITVTGGRLNVVRALQDTTTPTAPSNLAATPVGSNQVNLAWAASTDDVGVTGYQLERCPGAGCSNFIQISSPSQTSFIDTGLSGNVRYSYRVRALDGAGNLSAYSNVASATTPTQNQPPGAGTLTPANVLTSPGTAQRFTATYSDPDGFQNISDATLYIVGGGHNQWAHYSPSTNSFSLTGAAGGCTPGQAATLSTSFLTLNCSGSSASGSGTALTVNFSFTPQTSFSGVQYQTVLLVFDQTGQSIGKQAGSWNVNRVPSPNTLTPSNVTTAPGTAQSFTATYSDPDGFQNLNDASLYIAGGGNNQWAHYSPGTNSFTLTGAAGSCAPGQATTLSTLFLTLNCSGSSASGSGTALTVTFSFTPQAASSGTQYEMVPLVFDQTGQSVGKQLGSWTIPIRLQLVANGLTAPLGISHAGDGSGRLFVVEQRGTIQVLKNGVIGGTPFLDIRDRVTSGGETGLLGVAFHPNFSQNRRLYVNYTSPTNGLHTVISEFTVAGNPDQVPNSSERILLTIPQPFENHNGGNIVFGPDGFLYIGMGDGGSANDPLGNGQNLATPLGKMLRIDVDQRTGGRQYGIPPDNPFINTPGAAQEIWAYGFRNPWRFSFDPAAGLLYAGDVGQSAREEIDVVRKGLNYGWRLMEGTICTPGINPNCNKTGLELPIIDYDRSQGTTVIGGFVYRGSVLPGLVGNYIYGDFGNGRIWTLRYNGTSVSNQRVLLESGRNVSSFGVDEQRELYIVDYGGAVLKMVP